MPLKYLIILYVKYSKQICTLFLNKLFKNIKNDTMEKSEKLHCIESFFNFLDMSLKADRMFCHHTLESQD